ncbi:MAG: nucleotide exchange factor GrpE [Candidatus Uhrbacteria bacterium]
MSKKKPENQETRKPDNCTQCEEYLAGWKRALADYDNLLKDSARQKENTRLYLIEELADKLIPITDHFSQAMQHVPGKVSSDKFQVSSSEKQWLEGIKMIKKEMMNVLESFECYPIDPVRKQFDPHEHEAIGSEKRKDSEDEIILEVVERGWRLGNKVIRPAKVIVNKLA